MTSQCGRNFWKMRPSDWLLGQAAPNPDSQVHFTVINKNNLIYKETSDMSKIERIVTSSS